jgi:hypothetical protein
MSAHCGYWTLLLPAQFAHCANLIRDVFGCRDATSVPSPAAATALIVDHDNRCRQQQYAQRVAPSARTRRRTVRRARMPDRQPPQRDVRAARAPTLPRPQPGNRASIEIGVLSEHLGYFIRRLQVWVFQDFIRTLAPVDIRPAQYSVLVVIAANPGLSQSDLASPGALRLPATGAPMRCGSRPRARRHSSAPRCSRQCTRRN